MMRIEFVSTIPGLEMAWPVEPAASVFPFGDKAMKIHRCPGIHDWLQSGYLIRAFTDIEVRLGDSGWSVIAGDREHDFSKGGSGTLATDLMPPLVQHELFVNNVLKLELPWLIRTPPGTSCLLVDPFYHSIDDRLKWTTYPGVVDTDGLHRITWVFTSTSPDTFVIPRGTPLLQVIPMLNTSWRSTVKRGDLGDWLSQHLKMSRLKRWYWRTFHCKKEYK